MAVPTFAMAQEVDGQTARRTWMAWQCAAFAEYMDDVPNQQVLFERGLAEGRALLQVLRADESEAETLLQDAPIGLLWVLGGPSDDFILGRLYEAVASDTGDIVTKEDLAGLALPVEQWDLDDELQAAKARFHYERSNCAIFIP